MRRIHLAKIDKTRPVVILTREAVRPFRRRVTVAPITSTIRGLSTEVLVGKINGLDHESVVSLDNIITIEVHELGRLVGYLTPEQNHALTDAIVNAFDLETADGVAPEGNDDPDG
jgi:mRNA interferase MazF